MAKEKKMTDQEQMDVAVNMAALAQKAASNGGNMSVILNAAVGLCTEGGCRIV